MPFRITNDRRFTALELPTWLNRPAIVTLVFPPGGALLKLEGVDTDNSIQFSGSPREQARAGRTPPALVVTEARPAEPPGFFELRIVRLVFGFRIPADVTMIVQVPDVAASAYAGSVVAIANVHMADMSRRLRGASRLPSNGTVFRFKRLFARASCGIGFKRL